MQNTRNSAHFTRKTAYVDPPCEIPHWKSLSTPTGGRPKMWHTFFVCLICLTSSNFDQFSQTIYFHCKNQQNICNNNFAEDPTKLQTCRLHVWSLVGVATLRVKYQCINSYNWIQDDFCNKITTRFISALSSRKADTFNMCCKTGFLQV